jgi:hypothetical protein
MNTLLTIGPYALLAGLAVALLLYAATRTASSSFLAYALRAALVGLAAFVAGTVVGIGYFCAPADAGNLCGLGGIFGSGPLIAGVAVAIHAFRWSKRARAAA